MIRKAFVLEVSPDKHTEYTRRHNPIWPELEKALKDHGAHNYSIFLQPETSQLFGYLEIEDEARFAALGNTEVMQKWRVYMKEVMPVNPDNSPKRKNLNEVFHID